MTTPEALIEEARTWVGVPFRHQGRSRLGVDCAGFIVETLRATNALPPEFEDATAYGRMSSRELGDVVRRYCTPIPKPEPGALLLIRWPREHVASHVALFTGENLIHCYATVGKVVEHGYRGMWLKLSESWWRLPGVAYE